MHVAVSRPLRLVRTGRSARMLAPALAAWGRALLLLAPTLAVLAWLTPPRGAGGDGPIYLGMVRDLGAGTGVQAHRVLGPWLVSLLPLAPEDGFRLLTYLSLALAALVVWSAARPTLGERAALWSLAAYLAAWAVIGNLWDYLLVDPLAWVFVAGTWWGALRRQALVAALAGGVGGAAKEVVALAAWASGAALWERERPMASLVRLLAVGLPSTAVVFLLLRWAGFGGGSAGSYWSTWSATVGSLGPSYLAEMTFASYGWLWVAAAVGLAWAPPRVRAAAGLLVLANLPLLLLGTPERMVEMCAPAVATLAGVALARLHAPLAAAVVLATAGYVLHKVAGTLPGGPPLAIGGAALAAGLVAMRMPRLRFVGQVLGAAAVVAVVALWATRGAPRGGFAPIVVDPSSIPRPRVALVPTALATGLGPDGTPGLVGEVENQGRSIAWDPRVQGASGRVLARAIPPAGRAPVFASARPEGYLAQPSAPPGGEVSVRVQPARVEIVVEDGRVRVRGRLENQAGVPLRDVRVAALAFDRSDAPVALAEGAPDLDDGTLRPGTSEPFSLTLPAGTGEVVRVTITADGVPVR